MDTLITAFALIGNALNIAYNIPLVWKVLNTGSAKDISTYFLTLRISGSISWLCYAILTDNMWILTSYLVTLSSSIIILIVKCRILRCVKEQPVIESINNYNSSIKVFNV